MEIRFFKERYNVYYLSYYFLQNKKKNFYFIYKNITVNYYLSTLILLMINDNMILNRKFNSLIYL